MSKFFSKFGGWIVLIVGVYLMYKYGVFDNLIDYVEHIGKPEQVIMHDDGSYSTVKYKTIFDVILGK